MRIWDINVKYLCRKHLLGEHRELHGLWNILTIHKGLGGYSNHPETKKWVGKLNALYIRHEKLANEMKKRNYKHYSILDKKLAKGEKSQKEYVDSIKEQKNILTNKNCECFLNKNYLKI